MLTVLQSTYIHHLCSPHSLGNLPEIRKTLFMVWAHKQDWKKSTWQRGCQSPGPVPIKGLIVPPRSGENNAVSGVQCSYCVHLCDTGSQRWHQRHGCRITQLDGGEGGEVMSCLEVKTCPRKTVQTVTSWVTDARYYLKIKNIIHTYAGCFVVILVSWRSQSMFLL